MSDILEVIKQQIQKQIELEYFRLKISRIYFFKMQEMKSSRSKQ